MPNLLISDYDPQINWGTLKVEISGQYKLMFNVKSFGLGK